MKFFDNEVKLPLVYESQAQNESLPQWFEQNQSDVRQQLLAHGAVLFRNFAINDLRSFDGFVSVALGQVAAYVGGATPRKQLSKKIATSTEFPPDQEIKLHNELSYEINMPDVVIFCCLQPPQTGGQTQIVDVQKVLSHIDPEIVAEFKAKNGWKLIRNFGGGFGPTIKAGFGTEDLEAIKLDCQNRQIDFELVKPKHVRTTQVRKAIHNHPLSGDELWLNHVAFWHTSSLPQAYFDYMSATFSLNEFPYLTLFGDGSTIPDAYIDNIRQAYEQCEVCFDWQMGDVLLVDNYRVAHGRKPFTGERKVVVTMGDMPEHA